MVTFKTARGEPGQSHSAELQGMYKLWRPGLPSTKSSDRDNGNADRHGIVKLRYVVHRMQEHVPVLTTIVILEPFVPLDLSDRSSRARAFGVESMP